MAVVVPSRCYSINAATSLVNQCLKCEQVPCTICVTVDMAHSVDEESDNLTGSICKVATEH